MPILNPSTLHFIAAGSEVEVKDQQIQTETIKTKDHYVQVESMALQQGMYATVGSLSLSLILTPPARVCVVVVEINREEAW